MEKKRSLGVTIFGGIYIIFGLFNLFAILIASFKSLGQWKNFFIAFGFRSIKTFYYITPIFLFGVFVALIIPIVSGIGILKLRPWARYIIVTLALTSIIATPNKGLLFGWQSLSILEILSYVGFNCFVLWFFIRMKTKEQFAEEGIQFKLKSRYGTIIFFIIFLSLFPLIFVLGFKMYSIVRLKEPFFTPKPQIIKLEEIEDSTLLVEHRRIELFDTSVLIPRDFLILSFFKPTIDHPQGLGWSVFMANPSEFEKGFIALESRNIYEMMKESTSKIMRFKNTYEFEYALHINNWSPIFIILRSMNRLDETGKIEQFESQGIKGFLKSRYIKNSGRWIYEISFYSKDGKTSKVLTIVTTKEDFNRNNLIGIISSINLLPKRKVDADKYYNDGLESLNSNDSIQAQFKFANAYYLSPDNLEYGYMLAKALFMKNEKSFHSAKRILEDILKLKSDYEEAKELLEAIELKLLSNSSPAPKVKEQFK